MNADWIPKGWCPNFHVPMMAHDGWLVRVTPDLEGLTADALDFLSNYASRYGNGVLALTSRGNIQLRGLAESAARRFSSCAAAQGLGLTEPQREARRRILFMSPLAGWDVSCAADTLFLARQIELALTAPELDWHPPEKFSLVVDGGGLVPLGALRADIMVRHEDGEWRVHHGVDCHSVPSDRLVGFVMDLVQASIGQASGLRAIHRAASFTGVVPPLVGPILPGFYGVSAILGQVSASSCAAMATAGVTVRTTPWRGLVLNRAFEAPDLSSDPGDERRLAVSCVGAEGCDQARASTRRDALALVPFLHGRSLHVSGCVKGCALRMASDVTLVARDPGYDLIWNGKVTDAPEETRLTVEDVRRRLCPTAKPQM